MSEYLRERILRKLDTLSDERLYEVLDYVEFLESKYAARRTPTSNIFTRFSETVEDSLRAGRVSASTVAETMTLLNKAMGVLSGVAAAGKSVADDLAAAARSGATPGASGTPGAPGVPGTPNASSAPGASSASNTPSASGPRPTDSGAPSGGATTPSSGDTPA